MKIKFVNLFLLLAAAAVFIYAFFIYDDLKPIRYLPIFGEKSYESKNGKTDTTYHTIQNFSFTNQDGKTVNWNENTQNKVAIIPWWNGYSGLLDLTNPVAQKWFNDRLDNLVNEYGVDGFKLDAGDGQFYKDNLVAANHQPAHQEQDSTEVDQLRKRIENLEEFKKLYSLYIIMRHK